MRIARVVVVFLILLFTNVAFALEETYETFYSKAREQALKGEFGEAEKNIEKAISLNPSFAPSYVTRSGIYLKEGSFEKSIEDANKAISLNPKLPDAYKNRAVAYIELKDFEKAREDVLKYSILNSEPDYLRALYKYAKGDYLEAVKEAATTLKQNPKESYSAVIRLASYVQMENYPRGLEVAKEMVALDPSLEENQHFLFYRAVCYSELNRPQDALKDVKKLVALDPENPDWEKLRTAIKSRPKNTYNAAQYATSLLNAISSILAILALSLTL